MDLGDFDYGDLGEEEQAPSGNSVYTADYRGEQVYVKHMPGAVDSDVTHPFGDAYLQANTAAEIVLRDLDVMPEQVYDEASGRIVTEDAGEWIESRRDNVDVDRYVDAVLAKYLVHDKDLRENILVDDDGVCHPIDFDLAGRVEYDDVYEVLERTREAVDWHLLASLDETEGVEERARRLAEQMDFDRIYDELDDEPLLDGWSARPLLLRTLAEFQHEFDPDSSVSPTRRWMFAYQADLNGENPFAPGQG